RVGSGIERNNAAPKSFAGKGGDRERKELARSELGQREIRNIKASLYAPQVRKDERGRSGCGEASDFHATLHQEAIERRVQCRIPERNLRLTHLGVGGGCPLLSGCNCRLRRIDVGSRGVELGLAGIVSRLGRALLFPQRGSAAEVEFSLRQAGLGLSQLCF